MSTSSTRREKHNGSSSAPKARPHRDQGALRLREVGAEMRVDDQVCFWCGETEALALQKIKSLSASGRSTVICHACRNRLENKSTFEEHHVAGRANHPGTVPVPVTEHRAVLSHWQSDWAPETLRNVNCNPMLTSAACIQGYSDLQYWSLHSFLNWQVEFQIAVNDVVTARLGPHWWAGTEIERLIQNAKFPEGDPRFTWRNGKVEDLAAQNTGDETGYDGEDCDDE